MSISAPRSADDLVQTGRPARIEGRHVNMPIELGSTMAFDTLAAFETARDARYTPGTAYYGRYGNAATHELEKALARLEGADGVTLTSSGVAAITLALMTFVRPGAHLLVADHVYGNTRAFCDTVLARMGVEVEYYDPMIGAGIAALLRDTTCAVMFEAPGSGTFEVPDIPGLAVEIPQRAFRLHDGHDRQHRSARDGHTQDGDGRGRQDWRPGGLSGAAGPADAEGTDGPF